MAAERKARVSEPDVPKGAPAWMVTYGDSITLLLTFFVMLMTFSTGQEEQYGQQSRGVLEGSRRLEMFSGEPGEGSVAAEEKLLPQSRLDSEGAAKPSDADVVLAELKRHFEQLDIADLQDMQGGRVVRIPLVELFGTGDSLAPDGQRILDYVVKIARARTYSVVVRAAAPGRDADGAEVRSMLFATQVAGYVRRGTGQGAGEVGVSANAQLLGSPLREGMCEIIMLEV